MKKSKQEFDFFNIDQNTLDTEWVAQPKVFYEYAIKLADARRDLEQSKAALDVVRAELDSKIRINPDSFGVLKVTETVISNTIITQTGYQDSLDDMLTAKHNVDILQAAVNALDHRKSALERLVSLHGQNYFSTPKAPDEAGKEIAHDIEKKSVRGKRRRRRPE